MSLVDNFKDAVFVLLWFFCGIIVTFVSIFVVYVLVMFLLPRIVVIFRQYRINMLQERRRLEQIVNVHVPVRAGLMGYADYVHHNFLMSPYFVYFYYLTSVIVMTRFITTSPNRFQRLVRHAFHLNQDDETSQEEYEQTLEMATNVVGIFRNGNLDFEADVESIGESSVGSTEISLHSMDLSILRATCNTDLEFMQYVLINYCKDKIVVARHYRAYLDGSPVPEHFKQAFRRYEIGLRRIERLYSVDRAEWYRFWKKPSKFSPEFMRPLAMLAIGVANDIDCVHVEVGDTYIDVVIVTVCALTFSIVHPAFALISMVYLVFRFIGNFFLKAILLVILCGGITWALVHSVVSAGSADVFIFGYLYLSCFVLAPVFGADITLVGSLGFFTVSFVMKDEQEALGIVLVTTIAFIGMFITGFTFFKFIFRKVDMEIDELERKLRKLI